jgi:hypothetical protein
MNHKILLAALIVVVIGISGCGKDNAAAWVGVYSGTGFSNTFNQVTISEVNSSTLKIQLQVTSGGFSYTFATLQAAKLQSANGATVNETGLLYGSSDQWQFTGSGVLSGNSLVLAGQGKDVANDSIRQYYFTGNK